MTDHPSILIVDDDEGIRRTLEMILTRRHYRAFTAPDGKAALALARQNAFNLALLDIRLPDVSGADLLAQIKAVQPDLEALIITGNATLESAIQALANGAYHYFIKPLNPDELLVTLEQALHKQRLVIENRNLLASVQSIFRAAPVGIGLVSNRVLLQVNDRIYEMTGYTRDELIGQNSRILYATAEDFEYVGTEKYRQIRAHGIGTVETHWRRKDGTVLDVLLSSVPLDPSDLAQGLTFTALDITERKRAEEALRASEERFRGLFENVTIGLYRTTPEGRILLANPTAIRMLGYTSFEELAQRNLEAEGFEPDYSRAQFRDRIEREGEIHGLESAWTRRDGTVVYVRESAKAIRDAAGKILYYEGTVEDITERKRAEDSQRAAEANYRDLFENVPDGVYRSTLAGKFLTVNPALVQIFGYASAEELLAADISRDFFDQPETRQAWIEEILQKGELRNVEATVKRKDGQPIVVLDNCRVVRDAQGAAMYLEGTLSDITERKQRERELQAVAAISAALRAASTREEMLRIVLAQVQQFLNADAVSINTRDLRTGDTVIELAHGAWASATGSHIPAHQGVAARVIGTGQFYITSDLQNDSLFYWKELIGNLRGFVAVPLLAQERVVGMISIGRMTPITPEEVRVLNAIANIAASALHRAALHEKTEQRLQHLVALRTVDQTINASLDLRFTLDILIDQVIAQLRVDAAAVLLYDSALQTLDYAAGRGFRTKEIERLSLRLGEGYAGKVALERRTLTIRNLAASQETGRAAILAGEGFVAYCGVPLIAKGQVTGALEVFHRAPFIADPDWINLLEMLAGQAAIAIDNARLFEDLQRSSAHLVQSYDATIEGWSRALELRDPVTEGHTQRVAELTEQLARAAGIGEAELVHLRRGALLHDIGKIAVPDHILLKETGLTEDEWVIMRRHPEFAYELLRPIPYLQPALDIPRYHHEKWDGSGYPRGLQGEAIPLPARIFALVDVWDALRSDRPYRAAWSDPDARTHIRAHAGTHFDPNLVERFLKLVR